MVYVYVYVNMYAYMFMYLACNRTGVCIEQAIGNNLYRDPVCINNTMHTMPSLRRIHHKNLWPTKSNGPSQSKWLFFFFFLIASHHSFESLDSSRV